MPSRWPQLTQPPPCPTASFPLRDGAVKNFGYPTTPEPEDIDSADERIHVPPRSLSLNSLGSDPSVAGGTSSGSSDGHVLWSHPNSDKNEFDNEGNLSDYGEDELGSSSTDACENASITILAGIKADRPGNQTHDCPTQTDVSRESHREADEVHNIGSPTESSYSLDSEYSASSYDPEDDESAMPCEEREMLVNRLMQCDYTPAQPGAAPFDDREALCLIREERKRMILDRLIDYYHESLQPDASTWTRSHGSGDSNSSGQPAKDKGKTKEAATGASNSTSQGARGQVRKRARKADDDNGEDGPSEEKRARLDNSIDGRKFACPFYKKDPPRYQDLRACTGPGWLSVHRVKEHIYRVHSLPISCPRCHMTFENEGLKAAHLIAEQRCKRVIKPSAEGADATTREKLKSRKSNKAHKNINITEAEKWTEVFLILFPGTEAAKVPSPYYGDTRSDSPSTEGMRRYDNYMQRELPELLRHQLASLIDHKEIEELEMNMRDMVRDAQQEASRRFFGNPLVQDAPADSVSLAPGSGGAKGPAPSDSGYATLGPADAITSGVAGPETCQTLSSSDSSEADENHGDDGNSDPFEPSCLEDSSAQGMLPPHPHHQASAFLPQAEEIWSQPEESPMISGEIANDFSSNFWVQDMDMQQTLALPATLPEHQQVYAAMGMGSAQSLQDDQPLGSQYSQPAPQAVSPLQGLDETLLPGAVVHSPFQQQSTQKKRGSGYSSARRMYGQE